MQMHGRAYKAEDVVRFLRLHLTQSLRQAVGDLGWSPIHQAEVIKKILADGAAKRLHLERFPGYAPDLNPQEHVWNLLKRRELKNLCCRDLAQPGQELILAKERLRHRREILQNCFAHALGEV
jgi:transposase